MLAAMSVIWEGVCDRHPRVRIAFLESGGGWIAPWLDRMDRHFDDQGFNDSGLSMRPSDLFKRNCWISFEPVEGSLSVLADYIGPHKILWATDYPHPDGFFPGAPKLIADRRELSPETKRQILTTLPLLRTAERGVPGRRAHRRAHRGPAAREVWMEHVKWPWHPRCSSWATRPRGAFRFST